VQDDAVFACADGHPARTHVERVRLVEGHDCAGCLHRLQHHARQDAADPLYGAADACAATVLTSSPVFARAVFDPAAPRGPPAA
jgi:hypothetical protein